MFQFPEIQGLAQVLSLFSLETIGDERLNLNGD